MASILSQKNWFTAIRSTKKCFPAIWTLKKLVPRYFEPKKHCYSYLERKKWIPAIQRQKMEFTTVRRKEKDYDMYIKSEKLVHSNQDDEKHVSQLFGSGKNWFLAISCLINTVAAIWREKYVIPAILRPIKCSYVTTVRSKEKDYVSYLNSEKLVYNNQEHEKNVSHLFGS